MGTVIQPLAIRLDGITADDYLTWVRDPEPPALGRELASVTVEAEQCGDCLNLDLVWAGQPPATPTAAAVAAGFALTPEVVSVICRLRPPGVKSSTGDVTGDLRVRRGLRARRRLHLGWLRGEANLIGRSREEPTRISCPGARV